VVNYPIVDLKKSLVLLMDKKPSPVNMANILLLRRFYASQVVQDFFHQHYHTTCISLFHCWRIAKAAKVNTFDGEAANGVLRNGWNHG